MPHPMNMNKENGECIKRNLCVYTVLWHIKIQMISKTKRKFQKLKKDSLTHTKTWVYDLNYTQSSELTKIFKLRF